MTNPSPGPDWAEEYLTMLDDCEKRRSRLTDWELSFVQSVRSQLSGGRHLTAKQIDALDEIWERVTAKG